MNNKDTENLLNAYRSIYLKEETEPEMETSDTSEEPTEDSDSEGSGEDTENNDVEVSTEEYKG